LESTPQQKRRAILMIVAFTLVAAVAQPLFKTGANRLLPNLSIMGAVTDVPLIVGLVLYAGGAALMILALRHGQLSVLYPIISLSYVWVAILSVVIFHETMKPLKVAGILTIITGVAILGRDGHK